LTRLLPAHSNNFTLLRHIAAFLVLYSHCATVYGTEEVIYSLTNSKVELSVLGVKIFFIISGYLVTKSLVQSKGRLVFARKRILRLWPALFEVTFILAFIAGPLLSELSLTAYFSNSQTWLFFVRNILFLPVFHLPGVFNNDAINSPFWTLFFEVGCYCALFLLGKHFVLKNRSTLLVLLLLLTVWKYAVPSLHIWPTPVYPYLYGISDMMFLFYAAGVAFLFINEKLLYLAGIAIFLLSLLPFVPLKVTSLMQDAGLLLFVIEWGRSKPVLKWPAWDISYGTYLFAFPVEMFVVHQYVANTYGAPMVLFFTLVLTIPLAFASWYFIEKPALRFK
jgi:peptidoglycan/LPS O-acetylase OafA/YrhL